MAPPPALPATWRVLLASLLPALAAGGRAQEPADARWWLFAQYPGDRGGFRDQGYYLHQLQQRFGSKGLQVTVLFPEAVAARHAWAEPSYAIGVAPGVETSRCRLVDRDGRELWSGPDPDVIDLVHHLCSGAPDTHRARTLERLHAYVAGFIEDGPDVGEGVARYVELAPRSGYARACGYVNTLWYRGDPVTARRDAEMALTSFVGETWPMTRFCDLVLRADPYDRRLASRIALAMEAVAPAVPAAALPRLTLLRARLRADPEAVEPGDAEQLWPLVSDRPEMLIALAETVAGARNAARFRDLARRAVDTAAELGADPRWLFGARHKVLLRCDGDAPGAARLVREYLASDAFTFGLNNDAWFFMTRP